MERRRVAAGFLGKIEAVAATASRRSDKFTASECACRPSGQTRLVAFLSPPSSAIMRIIAGKYRRKQLAAASGLTTRPLTDRVKERLFQRLEPFDHERILDMFAGTGTIGLEAISRGAASAVFIERDHKAFDLLKQNIADLGLSSETLCWRTDALRCSYRPKGRDELLPFDRIFCDPPYPMAAQIRPGGSLYRALDRLARADIAAPGAEVILRVPTRKEIEIPSIWRSTLLMEVGGMAIHQLMRADAEDGEGKDNSE